MKPQTKLNARPRGAKARKSEIPVMAAKRTLNGIRDHAEQGSAEDQRTIHLSYPMANSPLNAFVGGAGLESSD